MLALAVLAGAFIALGAVFLDFSIDQGGCSETSRPTTLRDQDVYKRQGQDRGSSKDNSFTLDETYRLRYNG